MKVRVEGDNLEATVKIVLDKQDLATLGQLVACGGLTAGATAPTSPFRDAVCKAIPQIFPRESSQQSPGPRVEYRLARK